MKYKVLNEYHELCSKKIIWFCLACKKFQKVNAELNEAEINLNYWSQQLTPIDRVIAKLVLKSCTLEELDEFHRDNFKKVTGFTRETLMREKYGKN